MTEHGSSTPQVTVDRKDPIPGLDELDSKKHRGMTSRQRLMCYLSALGLREFEIARMMNITPQAVNPFLSLDVAVAEVERIQERLWGGSFREMIQKIAPQAIQTAVQIMLDDKVKASTRLAAAESFMDRTMGKAVQQVEVNSNLLRSIFEKMDADKASAKTVEVETVAQALTAPALAATVKEEAAQPTDAVDRWVKENL